jgi:hypothetical protein
MGRLWGFGLLPLKILVDEDWYHARGREDALHMTGERWLPLVIGAARRGDNESAGHKQNSYR